MVNIVKRSICLLLCGIMLFSLSACSSNVEMTEENVNATVEAATTALKEFDTKELKKYVDSDTLSYILDLADKHDQFAELGRSIFGSLTIEVKSIDLDAQTVTVSVSNKNLYIIASNFTYKLMQKYSTLQLLRLLDQESFLDISLTDLTEQIEEQTDVKDAVDITLTITQGKKNLVLGFDEDAEDAVSGGALKAIKTIIGQ